MNNDNYPQQPQQSQQPQYPQQNPQQAYYQEQQYYQQQNQYTSYVPQHPDYHNQYVHHQFQQDAANPTNGLGVAGFILSLIGLFFFWTPIFGWILWVVGLIFSCIGVTRNPKGLAIAGLVISGISLIISIIWSVAAISVINDLVEEMSYM